MRAAVYWQKYVETIVNSNTHNILDTGLEHPKLRNSGILKAMLKT